LEFSIDIDDEDLFPQADQDYDMIIGSFNNKD
jgi:hypothetical protein